ncbi:hypothetical protein MMS79_28490, partial [Escherichia coli]|nr:hypothetical protein [Escherichia coli]
QCRDTVAGTRNFEVHIAQVIFVAQNVRQYNVVVAFFHQTHCETLIARLIDRPIRPLFPEGFVNEVQVIATVVSVNPQVNPDIV